MGSERQNIRDIEHKYLEKENSSTLKYGLNIDITLEDFNLKSLNIDEQSVEWNLELPENVKSSFIQKSDLDEKFLKRRTQNRFDKVHEENKKRILKISIPDNTTLKKPIIINTKTIKSQSISHIFVEIGRNVKLSIIETLEDTTSEKGYNSEFIDLKLGKNSWVEYYHIQKLAKQKINYSRKSGLTSENATINWTEFFLGSEVTISDTRTLLEGNKSSTNIKSLFFADEKQQFDIINQGIHIGSETTADLKGKGVVKDHSKALYRGNIHIEQSAPNSEGYQKANLLMLDNEAVADAIPQLLIDNNEVKCSHGVTVGRVDEEDLFYLMTRGIDSEEAKRQIIKGFFEPAINNISIKKLADNIRKEIILKMRK
mgnify:CR=1 FL=1